LFEISSFVDLFFSFLFEPNLQHFSLNILQHAFEHAHSDALFMAMSKLLTDALLHVDDALWYSLIVQFLAILPEPFRINHELSPLVDRYSLLLELSQLPTMTTNSGQRINLVNLVLKCFRQITAESAHFRKALIRVPMEKITEILSGTQFGVETVDLLLSIAFEIDISLADLPAYAELRMAPLLTFIHECTKHLPYHNKIFGFIANVCDHSISNQLAVFRSNFLSCVLQFVSSFSSLAEVSEDCSISMVQLFKIFVAVAGSICSSKMFFELLAILRPINGTHRAWWVAHLLPELANIISLVKKSTTPSSFFHFDGRNHGISLPSGIKCEFFQEGLTFTTYFQLNNDQRSCLFFLSTTAHESITISFEDSGNLQIRCQRNDGQTSFLNSDYVFASTSWYHFAMAIDSQFCCLYVQGVRIKRLSFRPSFQLHGVVDKLYIGKLVRPGSSLRGNLTCVNLFISVLPPETIRLLSSLPADFVDSFSPNPQSVLTSLPKECASLFTESFSKKHLMCFNAKMTTGENTVINAARNWNAKAEVHAQIISFASTFVAITTGLGGIKLFLPLFLQIEMPVAGESQDSSSFLLSLLHFCAELSQASSDLEDAFFTEDGPQCLNHLLAELNPILISPNVITQLSSWYYTLRSDDHKAAMLKAFWVNYAFWEKQTKGTRLFAFGNFLFPLLQEKQERHVLICATTITKFVHAALAEKDPDIGAEMWRYVADLAEYHFPEQEAIVFFSTAFIVRHRAILSMLSSFLDTIPNGFEKSVPAVGFYAPVVSLFSSPDEGVRMIALTLCLQIFQLELSSKIPRAPCSLGRALLSAAQTFAFINQSFRFWKELTAHFMAKQQARIHLFPFLCIIAPMYPSEEVLQFVMKIDNLLKPFQQGLCESLLICPFSYFWLSFLMFAISPGRLDLKNVNDHIISLFAKLIATSICQEQTIDNMSVFFQFLITRPCWNLTYFLRSVYRQIIDILLPYVTEKILRVVIPIIFEFLFYIPAIEKYCRNL
jgi:hypothetical protein